MATLRNSTVERRLEDMKSRLGAVSLDGDDQPLSASITDDLLGLVLRDVPQSLRERLTSHDQENIIHSERAGVSATFVTGQMRRVSSLNDDYAATIKCVVRDVLLTKQHINATQVSKIHVETPFIGRLEPSLKRARVPDFFDSGFAESVMGGDPIDLIVERAHRLSHGDWLNEPRWTIGQGGLAFHGMTTTIPLSDQPNRQDVFDVQHHVDILRILLTLLHGGYTVDIESVRLSLPHEDRSFETIFPMRKFTILPYGTDPFTWNRLRQMDGLDLIGLHGMEKWFCWCSNFRNWSIVRHWMYSESSLASFTALEGIGRVIKRRQGHKGNVLFSSAFGTVLAELNLEKSVPKNIKIALNNANNMLVKHIGDLKDEDDESYRRFAESAAIFVSLLVGYALLKTALDELPCKIDAAWRREIATALEHVPKDAIDKVALRPSRY